MMIRKIPKIIALSEEGIDPFRQLAHLPCGGMFIFRHYHAPRRAELAGDLLSAARQTGRKRALLIAGDARLAHRLDADGLHYPEWQIRRLRRVERLKPGWQISAAAHSWLALRRAALAGADFALLSPVFNLVGKKTIKKAALGICRTAQAAIMAQNLDLPIYALGGISPPQKAQQLAATKIAGWAGVRAFALKPVSD